MMYVFDTNSFIVLSHYFPERFPSFWTKLDELVLEGRMISVREVLNELSGMGIKPHMHEWIQAHKAIFLPPSEEESMFVSAIFAVPHFQYLVNEKQRLKGTPVADPFVVASAKIKQGCVVTEEDKKPNAAKIPNVCEHFGIDCTNLEGFMEHEGWIF
jgi:hypothetical protein